MDRLPLKKGCMILIMPLLFIGLFALHGKDVNADESPQFVWKIPSKMGYFNYPHGIAIDSNGNVYVADTNNNRIQKFSSDGIFLTKWGSRGTGDGEFNYPHGIAIDSNGNVYVADSVNDMIQKFSSEGIFLTKWGSKGFGDGEFDFPGGIALDRNDNVYVADIGNKRIQKFSSEGTFLTKWGSRGTGDGEFNYPQGIAVDSNDNVYVADSGNDMIQKFSSEGTFLTKWGSRGTGDGEFNYPGGIAVDSYGYVYVADGSNNRIQKFSSEGTFLTKWGSKGSGDGEFRYFYGVAIDSYGYVYVADGNNNRIQKFSSEGTFLTKWGNRGTSDGEFSCPYGIAVDSNGNVYVADTYNHRIQKFSSDGTFLTKWGSRGTGDGKFNWPDGIAVDSYGYVYVADTENHRIQKFSSDGTFLTKWGRDGYGSGDGEFYYPYGIAVDSNVNVYVADTYNHRIQKFSSDGTFLTKWGSRGNGDGKFNWPVGIAVDSNGYVYVTDRKNHRIQKFSSDGTFLTKWGSEGYGSGDGEFYYPYGIAVDSNVNVYVADTENHRIQKFSSDGTFLTKWGSEGYGDGEFNEPKGIAVDSYGYVNVADTDNHCIKLFSFNYQPIVLDVKNHCKRLVLTWRSYIPSTELIAFQVFMGKKPFTTIEGLSPLAEISKNDRTYEIVGLEYQTAYYIAVVGVDKAGKIIPEHVKPQKFMITGSLCFDKRYFNITKEDESAVITMKDMELNKDPNCIEDVVITVISDSDSDGISINLTETDINTGVFTSAAFGKDLRFTMQISDNANGLIRVADGDNVTAKYIDQNNEVSRMDRAIVDASPPTTILIPSMDFYFDGNNNYAAKDHTYKLSSTDSHSGVERIEYSIDGSPFTPFSGAFSLDTEGPHSIIFKAVDNSGIWEEPKTVTVIVDDSSPAAPCGLSGEQVDFRINLYWTLNSEADLSCYNVYRDGIKINTYMIYNTSHSEQLISGKTYKYNITAIDHVGNESDFSNTFPITTLSIPPTITSLIEGALYVDNILTIRGTTETGSYVEIFVNAISQGTTIASNTGHFSVSGVSLSDGENAISARSTNSYGVTSNESTPVVIHADLRPQPPAGLVASPGDTVVDITWNANQEPDIQGYHIYREKRRLNHALLRETSFKDILLINGRTYGYTVTAVDNNGSESYLSTPVTVIPVDGLQWEIPDF